jgi:hypothetical protein
MKLYSRYKFTILFAAMLLLLGIRLAVSGSRAGEIALNSAGILLLAIAVVTLCTDRRIRTAALAIGLPPVVITSVSQIVPQAMAESTRLAGRACTALFLAFTVIMIVRSVVTARNVTWDTIVGAFAGYVLIGIAWSQMYATLELAAPQSFHAVRAPLDMANDPINSHAVLEYFSFATLSTVGYGDVTPVSRPARSLACLEAICGQFYLAVLVAGLIGIRGAKPESETAESQHSRESIR